MKQSIYVIARDNAFLCRTPNDPQPLRFPISGIKDMPNIPFYHYLWDDREKNCRDFAEFKSRLFGENPVSKIFKPAVFLALPEDSIEVDKQALIEFFMLCGARMVQSMPECLLLSDTAEYAAITCTCRMTVLRLVRQKAVVQTRYLENRVYPEDEMKQKLGDLFPTGDCAGLQILLNGEIPDSYRKLGEPVTSEAMLERFIEVTRG